MSSSTLANTSSTARVQNLISSWGLLVLLIGLFLLFSILKADTFLTAFTFNSVLNARSIYALLALAVMIPLAANHFDLSVASVLGFAQVLANGLQTQQGLSWQVAVGIIVVGGGLVGFINGLLVSRAGVSSFIATLGSGTVLLGLNQWYTGGQQVIGSLPESFTALSGMIPGIGIPVVVLYVAAFAVLLWIVFEYLPIGRFLYIIGDNPRAADLMGINSARYITLAFVASGVLAAFAGVILQAQLLVGQSTVGQEMLLPAFTGALLGVTSVRPGRANVGGTLLAVAVLAIAVTGLSQLGAPFFVEPLFNGAMLITTVGLAEYSRRRRERKSVGG
ncbi:ABC transporter permease [Rhizobium sp. S152]|uniref:ABC transporter permease n=1 Tax=Rhizobium sp. S152 TaxID=3055038 RepID=UPI0025A995C3|nr:ABC transporter permease [Rhizobium sp. S152]MDM9625089.1 ABC transporter permease [Rhizobium sp. S152]